MPCGKSSQINEMAPCGCERGGGGGGFRALFTQVSRVGDILRLMPNTDTHANGSFSWIELATNDQNAAKTFYTTLLGWAFQDNPMGPDNFYTMFQLEGRNVGAAYTMQAQEAAAGVPPHWNLYISVANADATAKRAAEAGGKVLAGPFDVYTYGRMAVIQDPTGAPFCIWQANDHIGAGTVGENGTLCWADLSSPDAETAAKFYGDLFGWTFMPGDGGYLHIRNGEAFIGGMPSAAQRDPKMPAHWMIYLQVADCDATTTRAQELGAKVCFGPMDIPKAGRMTVLADPQGAVFSLFQVTPRG
jgi:predicted enzyme related to lactoylglutathione lyase